MRSNRTRPVAQLALAALRAKPVKCPSREAPPLAMNVPAVARAATVVAADAAARVRVSAMALLLSPGPRARQLTARLRRPPDLRRL